MATYPGYSEIKYINPVTIVTQYKTLISNFNDLGEEKRRRKWLYPKRNITLSYAYLSIANATTIWQFYKDRSGAYQSFSFFLDSTYDDDKSYEGEYVGTGDGSTVLFNLPSKNATDYTLYIDGVEQTAGGVDYTFGDNDGLDGADTATFEAAPASGERITYDFTGILKVRCRFAEDNLSFEEINNKLVTTGITLQGLLNS